jgi:hypothetical protein
MSEQSLAQPAAKPGQQAGGETRAITVEGAPCLVRDHPREATRRVTLILRRGPPEQGRPWLASAGNAGPVVIVGIDAWAGFELSVEKAADGFIETLGLEGRPTTELCLTGGSLGSFYAMILGALLAERLAPMPVKVVAFSVVTQMYRTDRGGEVFHPAIPAGLRGKPQTIAAMRKFPEARPFLEQAMAAGANLKVKVFGTPTALLEWQQFLLIEDLGCVSVEEVLADDINQDMMSWLMLSPNDAPGSRDRLIRWTAARNKGWAPRVVEAKVDRELPVALTWRKAYPSLAATFDKM